MRDICKVLILYHSGGGSTKTICEIYHELLSDYSADIEPINLEYDYKRLREYTYFIFAFPTYHCSPSASMMEFIKNMPAFDEPRKAFVFTTCGLYSGNTINEFVRACSPKNIAICGYAAYRSPATDGALLLPQIPLMFRYEKKIVMKIETDIARIKESIGSATAAGYRANPLHSLIEVLNYPNKVLGKAYRHRFKLEKQACMNCNRCVNNCIRHCWSKGENFPTYESGNCEFCFRCIHHCPKGAILLSAATKSKPKCNDAFYARCKQDIIKAVQERVANLKK